MDYSNRNLNASYKCSSQRKFSEKLSVFIIFCSVQVCSLALMVSITHGVLDHAKQNTGIFEVVFPGS